MSPSEKKHARAEVSIYGRVQLVMFRDFATRKARALGLSGFVVNRADGSVFSVAEGPREELDAWVARLHQGPLLAKVERCETRFMETSGEFLGFHIHYG